MHGIAFYARYLDGHSPVVQQQLISGSAVARQFWLIDADNGRGSGVFRVRVGKREGLSHRQVDALGLKASDADFRTLKISHQRHETSMTDGEGAKLAGAFTVIGGAAVGKVETGHVHPSKDQALKHLIAAGCRA